MSNLITKGIIGIQAERESDVKCVWVLYNMRPDYMENYILPLLPSAELAHKLIDAGYTSGIYDKREIGSTEILNTSSISLYSYAKVNLDGRPKIPAKKVWWSEFRYAPGIHKWCDYVYLFVEDEAKWYRWNKHRGYIETRNDHEPRDFGAWDD